MRRLLLFLVIGGVIAAFFALGLQHVVSPDTLKAHEHDLLAIRYRNPVLAAAAYLALI